MPDPTTEDLITETRTKLDQLIAQVAILEAAINTQIPPALTSTLINTRDKLQELITKLQAVLDRLEEYQNAYVNPDSSTLQQWEDTLELFEISLTVFSGGLGTDTGWNRDQERVRTAYKAVYRIIQKIADGLYGDDIVRGILQFIDTFGGTALQLTPHRVDQQGNRISTPYAETENPGGSIVFLYIDPDPLWRTDDLNRGYVVHIAENITHEFGHVLAFRNGADNSDMYKQWFVSWDGVQGHLGIGQYISQPFTPTEGWDSTNAGRLQNTTAFTGSELENERIANMFEAFITGYQPEINATDSRQQRAAWALWTFMAGAEPPTDVWIDGQQNTRPVGSGMLHWIQLYGA